MARTQRQVAGKVVAITGAGHGIGAEIARTLSRAGAKVALGDIDLAAAQAVADGLYGESVALALDVTDRASFAGFLDGAIARLGPLDVLVNNAGIAPASPRFVDQDPEVIRRTIDINLLGPLTGTQLALERMAGAGHIVNVASLAGKNGAPGLVTYAASKHGVVGLCDTLRAELGPDSPITVTCVMPGPVSTQMMDGTHLVKAVRMISPTDVATAVLRALQEGRDEVYVPADLGLFARAGLLAPPRVRNRLNRALGVDKIYTDIDPAKRAAYDARMGRPEPPSA
jgi:NAD(P)-dependent dehydrogenase (short-subunit alcohol dehydrogenase family)